MSIKLSGKALVIQIGETETRVASLTLGAKVPQIQASAVIPTPEGAVEDGAIKDLEAMSNAINSLRSQSEFAKARKVLFVLSSTQVISHVASVPFVKNLKKLPQILEANADMYFPVDVSDYKITWEVIGQKDVDGATQTQVQLWATPKALLGRYYLLARDCGLSVAAIDYCGHSFALGINASFAAAKPAKAKKAAKVKKPKRSKKNAEEAAEVAVAVAEGEIQPLEAETTTLYINLEQDHILLSFVQEDQMLLQRLLQRSDYPDTDLNDIFMEMEYFHAEFPACVSGDCVVSGSGVEDDQFMADLEELVAVPLQRLHCEPDQIWCVCLGASLTDLDFGDPTLDAKGSKKVNLNANIPLQPVLLGFAALVFIGAMVLNITGSKSWETELQGLRDQQMILNVQSAAVSGYAEKYNEYASLYSAYSTDWENLFQSVRTYNDNAGLILEELEAVLPKDAVVTDLTMSEDSMTVNTAFQEKEDVVYFLIALRDLKYATLNSISNLQQLATAQPEETESSSALGDSSALAGLLASMMGGSEAAPTEGSFEVAPTEGDDESRKNLAQDIKDGKVNPQDLLTDEFIAAVQADDKKNNRSEEDSLEAYLVELMVGYATGTLKEDELDEDKLDKLATIYEQVNGTGDSSGSGSGSGSGSSSGSGSGSSSGSGSGSINLGNLGNLGNYGGTTTVTPLPTGEELEELLEKYELTEQDLKDGLDNLETAAEFGVLDKHYSQAYTKYTFRALLQDATVKQRQAAIRNLLEKDILAMHQFFLLVQEDLVRTGSNNVLTKKINPDYWLDPSNRSMVYNSDQAMLDEKLPGLIDMLTKDKAAVEATEALIKTHYNLTRKLAGTLAVEMGKDKTYDSRMSFKQLQDDILSAKTKQDGELDTVVRKMLSPTALSYYNTIQTGGTTGAGSDLSDLLNQLLGGNTGSGSDVVLQEPAGNFGITVTLGYNDALIQAEQARKGLDYNAKIADPVEVAG